MPTNSKPSFLMLLLLLLGSCVSQTVQDQRFTQSLSLTAPTYLGPLTSTSETFTFAILGDAHIAGANTAHLTRMLNASAADGDSFFIFLGDIIDQGLESDFLSVYQALNTTGWLGKVFGVIGNHDIFAGGWNYFKQYWGPSSYTFDVANSRFIVLDTGDATVGAPQLAWLKTELKKTQPRNTFILSHYAPWIPGIQTYLRLSDENESVQLLKIAESFHVKGWFSGHYHSYIKSRVNNLDVVIAGGLGTRMPPINYNFYVQVSVNSDTISYAIKRVD